MQSRWSDVLFADISDAICEVMALYRMALMSLSVFWGVVGTIRWTFAVRANGRTVKRMADLIDGLSFSFIVLILLMLYDIRNELRLIRHKLKDGERE